MPSTLRTTACAFEDFRVRHESELATLYKRARAASLKITEEQWAAAIYNGAISQASQAGAAPQELATRAYLSALHARDLALALAVQLGCSDAKEHFAIEYMSLLRGLAEHITDDDGRAIALTKNVFDELCGPQNTDGRRKSIFENFDGRVSLVTWLREFMVQRETGRPPTAAAIRLQPSNFYRDKRADFLGFMELLDTLGAAPTVLPRHPFASRLWLAPLAVLVVVLISVKAATTRQSHRFAAPSVSAVAQNRGDRGVFQPTSREAPFQSEQSAFTSVSSDFGLGSDSSDSQSRQADQFAGDIEILSSRAEPKIFAKAVPTPALKASSIKSAQELIATWVVIPGSDAQLASARPLKPGELEAAIKATLKMHAFTDIGVSVSHKGDAYLAGDVYSLAEARRIQQIARRVSGVRLVHFLHPDVHPAQGPAYFGVTTAWAPEVWGAKVQAVFIGSPADKAGIKPGDVISEFDGKTVPDAKALDELIEQYSPGQRVEFRVWHNGQPLYVVARLGQLTTVASR